MTDSESERHIKLRAILQDLTEDERKLFSAVIDVERKKLHMDPPRNIQDDLWKVVTETIR